MLSPALPPARGTPRCPGTSRFIADGDRRWARHHGLSGQAGYEAGAAAAAAHAALAEALTVQAGQKRTPGRCTREREDPAIVVAGASRGTCGRQGRVRDQAPLVDLDGGRLPHGAPAAERVEDRPESWVFGRGGSFSGARVSGCAPGPAALPDGDERRPKDVRAGAARGCSAGATTTPRRARPAGRRRTHPASTTSNRRCTTSTGTWSCPCSW